MTISGVDYDVTVRPSSVTGGPAFGAGPGTRFAPASDGATSFDGAIGAVTGVPSGVAISNAGITPDAYSNNSNLLQMHWTFPVDTAGDVELVRFTTTYGAFQIGFDPAIPKLSTQTLFMKAQVTWARKDL